MLREYLLGALPEDLAAEVDTRLFAEDELHRELQEEQDSLIEDFVYGRLPQDEEMTFQSQCARSPLLWRKVESFRLFLAALERQPAPAPWDKAPVLHFSRFLPVLSPALALLVCVASLLYLKELRRNAALTSQLQASSRAPERVLTSAGGKPTAYVAFLSASVARGAAGAPDITIPASASVLEVQVEVHAPAAEEVGWDKLEWDMELLRGNEVIARSAHLLLHRIERQDFLLLVIDTGSIHPGSYAVRFSPHSEPGAVQYRPFHVVN